MAKKNKQLLDDATDLVRVYRQHPVLAAQDLLNIDLAVPQQKILNDYWFKNFVLVSAGRGSGKCITGDSLVFTDKGIIPIRDLGSTLEVVKDLDVGIKSLEGYENTSLWYNDGFQKVNKIETSFGYNLCGTDDHKVIVINEEGDLAWKSLKDISIADYVAIDRKVDLWSKVDCCSEDEALLAGLLVGDGCFRGAEYHLGFTNSDQEVLKVYKEVGERIFGFSPSLVVSKDKSPNLNYYRKSVWNRLEEIGIKNNILTEDKVIPKSVLKSSKDVVRKFIQGLYESDGGSEKIDAAGNITITTKSYKLAYQLHTVLLNFGIISSLKNKKVVYQGKDKWYKTITINSENIDVFYEEIGFISSYKNNRFLKIINKKRNPNVDVVPNLKNVFFRMWDKTRGVISYLEREKLKRYKYGYENPSYRSLEREIKKYPFDDRDKNKLVNLLEKKYFFDKVVKKEEGHEEVFDLSVPESNSFVANGFVNHNTFLCATFACLWAMLYPGQRIGLIAPSFRQAKTLFSEVKKIWSTAPILQEATLRKPIMASDRCYLEFRQVGITHPSLIEAIPLGDGGKIRGARYYVIIADEFAQIPEEVFNAVVVPMGATVANPMENVRRIARQQELIEKGLASQDDFQEGKANKIVMVSSAYYQFNHMYSTILEYEEAIRHGEEKYAVHRISYRDMPEGFLSKENIDNARKKLSKIEFRMEYEAIWEADSAGVFKASLIEKCKKSSSDTVHIEGHPGSQYVLGVDPARASDAFAICLLELTQEIGVPNKLVGAWEFYQNVYPKMAKTIIDLCDAYNVVAVHLDVGAGGGGLALKDLLGEEERFKEKRLLDAEDEETEGLIGKRILYTFQPSPRTNAEAVYATLNLMEQGNLTLPLRPQPKNTSAQEMALLEEKEKLFETVEELLRQVMLIEVTQNKTGTAHFDVPSGGGHAAQKKDLYTAYILAAKKAYDITLSVDEPEEILHVGLLENRSDTSYVPTNSLDKELDVLPAPVNSWAYRKTFKPG